MGRSDRTAQTVAGIIRDAVGVPRLGCEVGVWQGGLSNRLLKIFDAMTLLMVDQWTPYTNDPIGESSDDAMMTAMADCVKATRFAADRRIILVGSSVAASSLVVDGSLDWVYIDANHSYESVAEDLRCWWPKVRPGGLFAGHDYGGRLDRRGVFGVKRAVDEFVAGYNKGVVNLAAYRIWWWVKPLTEQA